jgi:PBP1b-binding outer membrane lipoprotein LpoB
MNKIYYPILAALMFWSCSSGITVSYDSDKNANWTEYRTFRIQVPDIEELRESRVGWIQKIPVIETNITSEMMERGYLLSKESDLVVTYYVVIANKQRATSTSVSMGGGGYGHYGGGMYGGVTSTNIDVIDYQEGTLYIDLHDTKTGQQIWHGAASKVLENQVTSKQDAEIEKAIKNVFYRFKYKSPDYIKP